MLDVVVMCIISMGKLGYKSVRVIRFLGVIKQSCFATQQNTNEFTKVKYFILVGLSIRKLLGILGLLSQSFCKCSSQNWCFN